MQDYISVRPCGNGFLFLHQNGRPLARAQFSGVLTKTITKVHVSYANFKSHDIWIIGDSLVASAGQAHSGSGERCLKVDGFNIQWLGFHGMQWKDFLPKFQLQLKSKRMSYQI
ncbi:hypothetical protein MAR_031455 [Mya arenaria]|uniref:Uncharacterized protein n=1 Tax=Mya arenaria TaxID=6604 RepID=A0ABY7F777_MYAAR|nr:hypothetical protein MAR_031455 [Mya arenaria]